MSLMKILGGILTILLVFSLISSFELEKLDSGLKFISQENVLHKEFGVINEQSILFHNSEFEEDGWEDDIVTSYAMRVFSTLITGIRIYRMNNTRGNAFIDGGGVNFTFVEFQFFGGGIGEGYAFLIELYQNGEESTMQPTTESPMSSTTKLESTTEILTQSPPSTTVLTTTDNPTTTVSITTNSPSTTEVPEKRIKEWGIINDDSILIKEKRFQNYPSIGLTATGNGSLEISEKIIGMRLTSLNFTDGFANLTSGGVNFTFVNFDFKGTGDGKPYDFNLELFGNSADIKSLSIILMILFSFVNFFF